MRVFPLRLDRNYAAKVQKKDDLYKYFFLFYFFNRNHIASYRQAKRPEGVRRNALRAQRPKSPHFEESAQA